MRETIEGVVMCMPHQKPAKQATREIRGKKDDKKHINFNRNNLEHGDDNFKDERKSMLKKPKKEKGFFAKLFS